MKDYFNTFKGSTFPDAPYISNLKVSLSQEIISEYLPEIKKLKLGKGLRLLLEIMADKEGFYKGSKSYRTNNPGNIGNTDLGATKTLKTLRDGIMAQVNYIDKIIKGNHKSFPLNKRVLIKPFFSKEIAKNKKNYGMSPYLPGYDFIFTGQIDQFVKIYSTGARAGNGYVNEIVSYFKKNGVEITPESKIQDIIKIA